MTGEHVQSKQTFSPPSPADLMARYLQRQAEAQEAGLADLAGDVQMYDTGPVHPIDAKLAWREARAVTTYLAAECETDGWKAPPNWPNLVGAHEPAYDLAFCVGNFPQLVRSLHPLLQAKDLTTLGRETGNTALKAPSLMEYAEKAASRKKFPQALLAVAGLRMSKNYDMAEKLIERCDADVPAEWQDVWTNEKAALAWHRGEREEAQKLWKKLPDSLPVRFNRGMAALFLGNAADAKADLEHVVAELPETSAWHHLARLYLTLAEGRS